MSELAPFETWLMRWNLQPDGAAIVTHSSHLLPVRRGALAAMLKIADEPEERRGCAVMAWWQGAGAAPVLAADAGVVLMERAAGPGSLRRMVDEGQDDEATRILATAAMRLHQPRPGPLPDLVPLEIWFRDLAAIAATHGGALAQANQIARDLLANQRHPAVLHGDIHHGNVLDFGERGWLAIDPKGLIGDPGYDVANILSNPLGSIAKAPGRLARQAGVIADATGMERRRVLAWALAYSGLSAAWIIAGRVDAAYDLMLAEIIAAELDRSGAMP